MTLFVLFVCAKQGKGKMTYQPCFAPPHSRPLPRVIRITLPEVFNSPSFLQILRREQRIKKYTCHAVEMAQNTGRGFAQESFFLIRIARPESLVIWHRAQLYRRPDRGESPNRGHFASLD